MRQIIISGRLGGDAEVAHTQQGSSFLKLRLANSEYGDKEGTTHWYSVVSFNSVHVRNASNFKKGSSVIIVGRYDDRLYTSRNGNVEIGRDIVANSIEFNSAPRNNENYHGNNQNNTQSVQERRQPEMKPFDPNAASTQAGTNNTYSGPQPVPTQTVQPTSNPAPQVESVEDDDLPF